jgi:hypothetical protein
LFLRTDPRLSVAPGVFTRKDADAGYLARGKLPDLANGPKGFTMKPLCVCASFGSMKPNTYEAYTLTSAEDRLGSLNTLSHHECQSHPVL